MALKRQLTNEEWDLLSIVTDPILLGEFLRNTSDGSVNRNEWPSQEFKYRWYQRDLLSDKTEYISLVAGRAVGKCNAINSRIYVYPYGYITVRDLLSMQKIRMLPPVYTMTEKKELIQRRITITPDSTRVIYRVHTENGNYFDGTDNHPVLTERGWVMIKDLQNDDYAAVMTYLPHDSTKEEFLWEELRWLGYVIGLRRISPEIVFTLKYQAQVIEMQRIAALFDAHFVRNPDGSYYLKRKRGPLVHYASKLIEYLRVKRPSLDGFKRVPLKIKAENLSQIKIFLEAFLSNYAEFTDNTVTISHWNKTFAYDIQELLLRFSVETTIKELDDGRWEIKVVDYYSYYNLFFHLSIPGVRVTNLKMPPKRTQFAEFARFDPIVRVETRPVQPTYAITVHETQNYICDNIIVHNSLVLEDKLVHQAVNAETEFPVTKESTLVTANVSQMTPILDRVILRFTASPLLKDFLKGNVNRSKGTLDFPMPGGAQYRINARIAGSRGENNMVGLHVPRIIGDEMNMKRLAWR